MLFSFTGCFCFCFFSEFLPWLVRISSGREGCVSFLAVTSGLPHIIEVNDITAPVWTFALLLSRQCYSWRSARFFTAESCPVGVCRSQDFRGILPLVPDRPRFYSLEMLIPPYETARGNSSPGLALGFSSISSLTDFELMFPVWYTKKFELPQRGQRNGRCPDGTSFPRSQSTLFELCFL